jgi:hypothetical protein
LRDAGGALALAADERWDTGYTDTRECWRMSKAVLQVAFYFRLKLARCSDDRIAWWRASKPCRWPGTLTRVRGHRARNAPYRQTWRVVTARCCP